MTETLAGGAPRLTRLCDYVRHYAARQSERDALVFNQTHISYRAFDALIDRCAAALTDAGVQPGDRVAMLTTPRPEFAIVLMAAQRVGAIWVGLNTRYRLPELRYILGDCTPRLLISLTETPDGRSFESDLRAVKAETGTQIITFPAGLPDIGPSLDEVMKGENPAHAPASAATENDPTVIVYTSGTTGRPKGALLAHRNLTYCYQSVSRSFVGAERARDDTRVLCNLPPNHIGCISELFGNAIIRGGAIVFADQFDPAETLDIIGREKITLFGGVPVMLESIFGHPRYADADLSSVRAIGWGGAPATRSLVERMMATGARMFTNYGLTEGGAVVTATPATYSLEDLSETVGTPDDSGDQRIVTDDGRDVNPGESGEIWLRGPGVFLGYWNNPEATAAATTADGWLKTGDIARATETGAWKLEGRKADMFKSGGFNVYPREIELALEEHPDVAYTAVVAVKDAQYFEVGAAFVVPKPDCSPTPSVLQTFLRERLANYKIPKSITIKDSLPMLPIGKVDKAALRDDLTEPNAATS